jgi:hypothetical protein
MPHDAEKSPLMPIRRESPVTDMANIWHLPVTQEQLDAWAVGTPIREAMPQLSELERIFVATGAVPADLTVDVSEQDFMDYMPPHGPDFG